MSGGRDGKRDLNSKRCGKEIFRGENEEVLNRVRDPGSGVPDEDKSICVIMLYAALLDRVHADHWIQ